MSGGTIENKENDLNDEHQRAVQAAAVGKLDILTTEAITGDGGEPERRDFDGSITHENMTWEERKARVNAAWNQMNSGLYAKVPKTFLSRPASERKSAIQKTPGWMVALGLMPKRVSVFQETMVKSVASGHYCSTEDARKAAAEALSSVKEFTAHTPVGKIEIKELKDFAGQEIEVKKLVDASSNEAIEKSGGAPSSALDAFLDQIKKKPKLSVLDKSKKDWGEFKDDHKGLEGELDAYKKSSNKYLDKLSFLQRADLREFERERDARLAMQTKKRSADMREDADDF